jgi:G3E family GTPase
MTARSGARIPILVVGGFLGSGKTTLVRHSLAGDAGTAIIVNEFGEIGHDHAILRDCAERVSAVSGGCACCVKRDDLVEVLRDLLDDHERGVAPLRRVLIEMSGLADPAPILFTIVSDPMLRHHFEVRRVVVTVDAVNARAQLAAHTEARKQALVADVLVITKADLTSVEDRDELGDELAAINPAAQICHARDGVIAGADDQDLLDERAVGKNRKPSREAVPGPGHTGDVESIRLDAGTQLDWPAFVVWLSMLLHARGEHVLRVKGVLALDDGSLVSINGVQHVIHEPEHLPGDGATDEARELILITRGMDTDLLADSLATFQRAGRPREEVRSRSPRLRQEVGR